MQVANMESQRPASERQMPQCRKNATLPRDGRRADAFCAQGPSRVSCVVHRPRQPTMSVRRLPPTPSTPIRAIPSTLLSRTAPTIPPASQLYEPLVKGVLRHRQYKIFLHSGLFCWFLVTTWATWSGRKGDLLLLPVNPSTLAYTLATFGVGALPVVVLRKSHLAGESDASPGEMAPTRACVGLCSWTYPIDFAVKNTRQCILQTEHRARFVHLPCLFAIPCYPAHLGHDRLRHIRRTSRTTVLLCEVSVSIICLLERFVLARQRPGTHFMHSLLVRTGRSSAYDVENTHTTSMDT